MATPGGIVGWGILGVGNVCEVKSGPAFQKATRSRLVAVMRRTLDKAVDFAKRHSLEGTPAIAAYDAADELIADPNVTAVYVASPPGSHLELAMKVLAAGKPCYVEKPLARNATESRAIADAFAKANVPLFVAYYRRGQPRFLKAKALIASGALGDVSTVVYRKASSHHSNPESSFASSVVPWRLIPEQAGGGLMLDVGCHALDILEYMLGAPLENVHGDASAHGAYPAVAASVRVEDRVQVRATATVATAVTAAGGASSATTVDCSWNFAADDETADLFTISGTAGTLQLSCFGTEPIVLSLKNAKGEVTTQEFTFPKLEHVQQPLVQLITDELTSTGDAVSPSKADNAIRVAEVMDAALSRYYGGRDDEFWKRPIIPQ